jgi:hypothetical protein
LQDNEESEDGVKTKRVIARPLLLFQEERQTVSCFLRMSRPRVPEINVVVFSAITISDYRLGFFILTASKKFYGASGRVEVWAPS